jgi:hypothetical protein
MRHPPKLKWLFAAGALLVSDPLTAQQVEPQIDVAFRLVPVESGCDQPLTCALEIVQRGDSSVMVSHPGDRYQIAFENHTDQPVYAGLLIVSGAMPLGVMAGPHPLWPDEIRTLPDTIVIDNRLGTDLLILLVAGRYFSANDFPIIYPEEFHGDASGWRTDDIVKQVARNEVGIRIAGVYYHRTTKREQ